MPAIDSSVLVVRREYSELLSEAGSYCPWCVELSRAPSSSSSSSSSTNVDPLKADVNKKLLL